MRFRVHLITVIIAGMAVIPLRGQTADYHWQKEEHSLALVAKSPEKKDFILWKINYDPKIKPFFHPLSSPDGTLLTADSPPDHLWHLGQWFCWKYINGLNYWEYSGDPTKAVSEGRTHVKDVNLKIRKNGQAKLVFKILYHPWNAQDSAVMEEKRSITISAPDPNGGYTIDYDMSFLPLKDVVLDRTPVQRNAAGVTWGGYAGLSMRFNQELSDPNYFSEQQDSVINGTGNAWVAANLSASNNKQVQVVMFDHPENPRFPSAWYTINRPNDRFWFLSPALLYHSALELKAGKTMRLRYRVLVPPVPLTPEQIKY